MKSFLERCELNSFHFIKSKVKFDVNDQQEFYRRFLIPRQNRIDLNKVYFEIEYNIDDDSFMCTDSSCGPNFIATKKL